MTLILMHSTTLNHNENWASNHKTRIMLDHLSGGASMKRRGKRRREKKEREKKKRGREKKKEGEKKKGGEKKRKKMLHRESNPRFSAWQVKALTVSYRRRLVRHVQLY